MRKIAAFLLLMGLLGFLFLYKENKTDPPLAAMQPTSAPELLPASASAAYESLQIHKMDSRDFIFSLVYNAEQPQFVSGWAADQPDAYVINGAYFDENYQTSGFFVTNGTRVGKRMFDQDKSGLVVIDNGVLSLRDLAKQPFQENEKHDFALQSYPFLMREGHVAISTNSGKQARRSAIGVDAQGAVYLIFCPDPRTTLHAFAQRIADTNIPFTHVLNLDGGPSAGLVLHTKKESRTFDSLTPVSSVVVGRRR